MKKRILLAIVAASLMLQTCPILVSAEQIPSDVSITEVDEDPVGRNVLLTGTCSKTDEDNVKWEVEKDEVSGILKLIISGEGEMRPTRASEEEEEGYRLTETVERQLRDQNLIDGNTYIEEVVICEGVKTVGGLSFSKMKKITLPEGLEVIDSEALFYCEELKEIKIPDSVKEIREFSLYGCKKLEKIDLPERDIQFGEKAFGWCRSLKELRIPEGVKKIYCNLWDWTDSLQKVYLPHSLEKFYEDFMKYTMTESFPALKDLYYNGTMDDWEKVEKYTFGDDRVEADGDESLMWKRIYHDYYLGDVTKHFQGTLFTGDCSNSSNDHVKWEAVMDKETGILKLIISGEGEMRGEFEEEELGFPNHVEGVLRNNHLLDANTHIEEIIICEGVKNVNGLQNNIAKKISLPEGLERIDRLSLSESTEVKEIIIPSTVNRLGEYAFWSCTKLEKIDFAKGDNDEDFSEKNIDLGYHTFELCSSLKELTIPDGVTKIHCALFASYGPQRLYLPHSLKIFYEDVYDGELAHLTDVYYDGTAQEWANVERYEQGSCYKRTGAEDEEEATCDRTYDDRPLGDVNMHFTGTLLSGDCSATEDDHVEWEVVFDKETGLLKLIISGDGEMKSTSDYRKNNEEGLTENIEKQLREIHVLNKNTYIEEIVINEGVKSVGGLSGSKVKTISLPEGLKRIDTGAFRGCEQLEEIKIPTSVKEIGAYAFYQCLKLKKIDLPKTDVEVAYKAFDGCGSLKELNIPEGVRTVYCNLFAGSGLQKLYLPQSMKKLYEDYEAKTLALSCPNLTDIYYQGTKDDWKKVEQYTIYEKYKPFEAQKWKRIYDNSRIGDVSMHFKSATILELYGKGISLNSKIGLSLYLTVVDQEAYEKNSLMMCLVNLGEYKRYASIKTEGYIWESGPAGFKEPILINIKHHTIGGKKVIEITYWVTAKKYSDNLKLEIGDCPISVNGKVMDSYECSIQSIAEQYLAKPTLYDKKTISLVKAIHNYGSYAQLLAGYPAENVKITDDLKDITAKTLKPYAPVVEGNAKIAKYAGIGLSLSTNTTMSVQFKLFDKPEEYSVEINGSKVSPKNVTDNIYYVDQNDLSERSLDRTFTITIRKGNEHYEIKVSPLSWSQSVLSNSKVQNETTVNMAKLLYRFYTYYQEYVKQK